MTSYNDFKTLQKIHNEKSRMFELTDGAKYFFTALALFAANVAIAYVSDAFTLLSGVQLIVLLTAINFFGRYALLKLWRWNK